VVLAHAGAFQQGDDAAGEIVDEAKEMDNAVDVIVAGHTHSRLDLDVGGKLIVNALAYGAAFDRVRITVDRLTADAVQSSGDVLRTSHAGSAPDPDLAQLVEEHARRWRRWPTASSAGPGAISTTRRSTRSRSTPSAPSPPPTSPSSTRATHAPISSAVPSPTRTPPR
jgi:2',3'-cyclic-nucleotide 2'-phosphodiesterase (5'-nucleotidase family)